MQSHFGRQQVTHTVAVTRTSDWLGPGWCVATVKQPQQMHQVLNATVYVLVAIQIDFALCHKPCARCKHMVCPVQPNPQKGIWQLWDGLGKTCMAVLCTGRFQVRSSEPGADPYLIGLMPPSTLVKARKVPTSSHMAVQASMQAGRMHDDLRCTMFNAMQC